MHPNLFISKVSLHLRPTLPKCFVFNDMINNFAFYIVLKKKLNNDIYIYKYLRLIIDIPKKKKKRKDLLFFFRFTVNICVERVYYRVI